MFGAIAIYRQEVRPFTDKQIELVKNFAAQAVIAIENTRLLNELRQRTDDLTEALEQQTATSEVLQVISSSPGELEPVFQAMLENATAHLRGQVRHLFLCDGDAFGRSRARRAAGICRVSASSATVSSRHRVNVARSRRRHQAGRSISHDDVAERTPSAPRCRARRRADLLVVPMLKDDELVGAIAIYRQEVRPFTDKQIELVQNFAAQAVIAIENTRLLNELRQRTDDLTNRWSSRPRPPRCCKVITSSPGELEPVFQAMLENAARICEANSACCFCYEGDAFQAGGIARRAARVCRVSPTRSVPSPMRRSLCGHAASARMVRSQTCSTTTIPTRAESACRQPDLGGARTTVAVPMLKEDELIGAIVIYRQEVRPFTDKQIELVRTSPPRRSSPSRTRGCSTSCAAHDELRVAEQQTATSRC